MKKQNEERREKIKSQLAKMLEPAKVIDELMKEVPHTRGLAYRSLTRGKEHIIHSLDPYKGLTIRYRRIDGKYYEISVTRVF